MEKRKGIIIAVTIYVLLVAMGFVIYKQHFPEQLANRLDSEHYVGIAANRYTSAETNRFAFFPLLPLEIKLVSFLTFGSLAWAALIACSINYFLLVFVLDKFLQRYCTENKLSKHTTLLLSIMMPFTVFLMIPYTEGLFTLLLFSILYLLAYKKISAPQILSLALLSAAIVLTRSIGLGIVFLFLPFVWKLFQKKDLKFVVLLIPLAFACFALLSFSYMGYVKTGDFLITPHAQQYWDRSFTLNIFKPFVDNIVSLFSGQWWIKCTQRACRRSIFIESFFFLFLPLCAFWFAKNVDMKKSVNKALLIFSIFAMILPLFSDSLMSYNRFAAIIPVYFLGIPILLQKKLSTRTQNYFLVSFIFIQIAIYLLYIRGNWLG